LTRGDGAAKLIVSRTTLRVLFGAAASPFGGPTYFMSFFLLHRHKKKLGPYILLSIAASLALLLTGVFMLSNKNDVVNIKMGDQNLSVMVADTDNERERGLSGKKSLANDEGMLFVFNEAGPQGIWMKDMQFSIDIIWIDQNNIVQGITPSVSPDSYPTTFTSPTDVKYVLEVNANWAKQHNLRAGAILEVLN
jgi:uncharacterized protein